MDEDPVVVGHPDRVDPPSLTGVWSTNCELWGMHVVSFNQGCRR